MNALALAQLATAAHATIVLLPAFDARAYIDAIQAFRCTWLTAVPPMIAMILREETLGGHVLDSRLAQLALVGVNAADRQEEFTYEHILGALKEKASAGQLVEAGVCAMLYGGLASWTTAAAAITRAISNSDDHTF